MRASRIATLAFLVLVGCGGTSSPGVDAPVAPPSPASKPEDALRLSTSSLAEKIDPLFKDATRGHSPGCAVGVFRAGKVVFAKGYGYADLEHDIPITDATVFYGASLAKQFTAAAIALLVQDGKLSLADDVRKYVPELPSYGREVVTVDQMLHHTSGLRDYATLLNLDGTSDDDVTNEDDAFFILTHQRGLNFAPGTRFSYSNSGYLLAAVIVRRLSGMSFPAFMKARVFDPLGMTSTHMRDDHTEIVRERAMAYVQGADDTLRLGVNRIEVAGDGGVFTNIRDLARWDANFDAPSVGGDAMLKLLRTRGAVATGKHIDYALGIYLENVGGIPRERHNAMNGGYRANLTRFPEQHLSVALLCNGSTFETNKLASLVAGAVVPEIGAALARATSSRAPAVGARLSAEERSALLGLYVEKSTGWGLTLREDDGRLLLRASALDDAELEFIPTDAHTLYSSGGTTRIVFEPEKGGRAARFVRSAQGESVRIFERTIAWAPDAGTLTAFVGRYESDELPRDIAIVLRDGALFEGPWGRRADARLHPVTRDTFVGPNEGGSFTIRFVRDARGRVAGAMIGIPQDEGEAVGISLALRRERGR